MLAPRIRLRPAHRRTHDAAGLRTRRDLLLRRAGRADLRRRRRLNTHVPTHEYEVVMTTLSIKDLHVTVETESGTKEILKGLTLDINSTETHAIMGPNGSGKSTL